MWSVTLKTPHGRGCVTYRPESGVHVSDIDQWVASTLGKTLPLDTSASHWIMYNDEPPTQDAVSMSAGGHCKGVLVWPVGEEEAGRHAFWMVHSVPRWPQSMTDLTFRDGECIYGQSMVWLPFDATRVPDVLAHLHLMQAHVYASSSASASAMIASKADATHLSIHEWHELAALVPGVSHCAKHAAWGRDLFEDGLVPGLFAGRSCVAETWMRPSMPATPHVRNVSVVKLGDVTFPTTHDHSKWAVTDAPRATDGTHTGISGYSYVGDINRMVSQQHRGGGGLVFEDAGLWRHLWRAAWGAACSGGPEDLQAEAPVV